MFILIFLFGLLKVLKDTIDVKMFWLFLNASPTLDCLSIAMGLWNIDFRVREI